ncbi:DNA polymerase I [Halorhodospira abdelmalekii]|uniref:DNA polymerase I n=1 Tax=Halorhodospira abdelmalekii TaxID=421629 RepID=UPI001907870B|nr:DNA polymerase I [Halorhodospira abdelmalekii]MBK1734218.1 DNA polymerase I [Halorhodospira abdelmalekii]
MGEHDAKLVLIDGSSYLYRAYYALPPLSNRDGEPTGALYGVLNMVRSLLSDEVEGQQIAVVFDAPGRTFRDDLFEQYKAQRPAMPEELRVQCAPLKAILAALGIPVLEVPGVEADDVIGTLARRASGPVVISTMDKDMAQLVDAHTTLLNTMSGKQLDCAGVEEKFGVPPAAIVDYLALVGDSSDNIPGVPKVGPKTAAKWLQHYGDLATLQAHADEIRGKVGESLRAHLDALPLAQELVTIRCDLELDVIPDVLRRSKPDLEQLRALYRRYELRRWLAELDAGDGSEQAVPEPAASSEPGATTGAAPGSTSPLGVAPDSATTPTPVDYLCVVDEATLAQWYEQLAAAEAFSFDLETDSLVYMDAAIVGVAVAVEPHRAAYIPLGHRGAGSEAQQLTLEQVLTKLRPLLEAETPRKIGQNLKYDMSVLARYGIELRGIAYDTMLESYVLDAGASRHDMDSLAERHLGVTTTSYEALCGKGAKQTPFAEIDLAAATAYAAEDADITLRLHHHLYPRLCAEPPLLQLFSEIEMPLLPVLSRMERTGVRIDPQRLQAQSHELAARMGEVEAAAHALAGEPFNLSSPRQIQAILFERMGLPVVQRTPKGQPSTAEAVLEELQAQGHELPRLLLEHRGLAKLKSTYTDKLPGLIHPRTQRVHTSYHQAVAATGRLSSTAPNLQNIPVRSDAGREIRKAFIAEPGYVLMSADYSQIELRIMAHLSQDLSLCQAFAVGEDVHRRTAAELFGGEQPTDAQRRAAKAINFGLMYGMSAWGLARQLGIQRDQAQHYIDCYFDRYPGVRALMTQTREQARSRGYVETLFGRRLYVPEIHSRNRQRREYAERTAINAPLQGSAADLIKRAMIDVDRVLQAHPEEARLVMQVHDELVLEVAEGHVDAVTAQVCRAMQQADRGALNVALEVEVGYGENWQEAH